MKEQTLHTESITKNLFRSKLIPHDPITLYKKQLFAQMVSYNTCLKKFVTVRVAGLKLVKLQASSPLVVLSNERRPTILEFLLSDHEPLRSSKNKIERESNLKKQKEKKKKLSKSLPLFQAGFSTQEDSCRLWKLCNKRDRRGGYAKTITLLRHQEAMKHSQLLLLLSQQPHPSALLLL